MLRATFNDGQPEVPGNFFPMDYPPTPSPPETFPSSEKRQRRLLGYSTSNNLPRAPHVKRTSSHCHLEHLAHLRTHSPPSLPSPFPILDRVASTVVGRLHTRRVEARTFKVTHRALLAVHFYPSHARTAVFFFSQSTNSTFTGLSATKRPMPVPMIKILKLFHIRADLPAK